MENFLMDKFLKSLALAIMPKPLPPLHLHAFQINRKIEDDTYNKCPGGDISCSVITSQGEMVGDFNYRIKTGQVGGMYLKEDYRKQTLEQQMLIYMMKDMKDAGATEIWEVINEETKHDSRFYSILWSFHFKNSHVHPSVTGPGYIMPIPEDIRSLVIVPGVGKYRD